MFPLFQTIQQALEACEAAGYQPRDHCNGLGEMEYWVHLPRSTRGECFFGDSQFLGWANAHFEWLEIERIRSEAGWEWLEGEEAPDEEAGWYSPCGLSEEKWRSQGRQMPEEAIHAIA